MAITHCSISPKCWLLRNYYHHFSRPY